MKTSFSPVFSGILLSVVFPLTAMAVTEETPPPCGAQPTTGVSTQNQSATYYDPQEGGINGHCGTSATGPDACQHFLSDVISGSSEYVMLAAQQEGGTADSFGCFADFTDYYKSVGIQPGAKGCIMGFVGDHYATSENGKPAKWDTSEKSGSPYARMISGAKADVQCIKKAVGVMNAHKSSGPIVPSRAPGAI